MSNSFYLIEEMRIKRAHLRITSFDKGFHPSCQHRVYHNIVEILREEIEFSLEMVKFLLSCFTLLISFEDLTLETALYLFNSVSTLNAH